MNICWGTVSGWRCVLVKCGAALNPLKLLESGGFFTQPISDAKIDQNPNLLWIYELKHLRTCERNKKNSEEKEIRTRNKWDMLNALTIILITTISDAKKQNIPVWWVISWLQIFVAKKWFENFNDKKYDIEFF